MKLPIICQHRYSVLNRVLGMSWPLRKAFAAKRSKNMQQATTFPKRRVPVSRENSAVPKYLRND